MTAGTGTSSTLYSTVCSAGASCSCTVLGQTCTVATLPTTIACTITAAPNVAVSKFTLDSWVSASATVTQIGTLLEATRYYYGGVAASPAVYTLPGYAVSTTYIGSRAVQAGAYDDIIANTTVLFTTTFTSTAAITSSFGAGTSG